MMKEFRSIVIDADSNTYTIKDGTQGEYKLSEIKKYGILNEHANYRGKAEPFLHQVLGGASSFIAVEPKLYVGIKITTTANETLAVYISENPVLFNSDAYIEDKQEAERVKAVFDEFFKK